MIIEPRKREHILPLPVVLISTVSGEGIPNVAPWSNITPILRPLDEIILASWVKRDTLHNIRATKDFVVNVPAVGLVEKVLVCARNYPPEVDEFVEAGLKHRRSAKVKSPGVQGCLAWAECTLVEEIERKNYSLIIGKVEHLEVEEQFFNEEGEMDYELARPLSAILGSRGTWFTRPVYAGRYAEYAEMFGKPKSDVK